MIGYDTLGVVWQIKLEIESIILETELQISCEMRLFTIIKHPSPYYVYT